MQEGNHHSQEGVAINSEGQEVARPASSEGGISSTRDQGTSIPSSSSGGSRSLTSSNRINMHSSVASTEGGISTSTSSTSSSNRTNMHSSVASLEGGISSLDRGALTEGKKVSRRKRNEYKSKVSQAVQPQGEKIMQAIQAFTNALYDDIYEKIWAQLDQKVHAIFDVEIAKKVPPRLNEDLADLKEKVKINEGDRASEEYSKAYAFHEFARELDAQHDNDEILSLERSSDAYFRDDDSLLDYDDVKRIIDAGKYQFPNEYKKIEKEFENLSEFQQIRQIKKWCKKDLLKLETEAPPKKLTELFPPLQKPKKNNSKPKEVVLVNEIDESSSI